MVKSKCKTNHGIGVVHKEGKGEGRIVVTRTDFWKRGNCEIMTV